MNPYTPPEVEDCREPTPFVPWPDWYYRLETRLFFTFLVAFAVLAMIAFPIYVGALIVTLILQIGGVVAVDPRREPNRAQTALGFACFACNCAVTLWVAWRFWNG